MEEPAHDVTLSPDGTRILVTGRAIPADKVLAVHVGLGSDIGGLVVSAVLAGTAVLYSLYEMLLGSKSLVWLYLTGIGLVVLVISLKVVSLVREKALYVYVIRAWGLYMIGPFSQDEEAGRTATAVAEVVENYREDKLHPIPEELRLHLQDTVLVGNSATVSGPLLIVGDKRLPTRSIRAVKLSSQTDVQSWAWALICATILGVAAPPFVLMIALNASAQSSGDYMLVLSLAVVLTMLVGSALQQIVAPRVFKLNIQAYDGAGIVYKTTQKNKAKDLVEQIKSRMERDKDEARTITVARRVRER
ncbi:MAG: hypothetical protein M3441_13140 [Chloroflexota bacterium]|nr:hypothetical protein [Chloroflexota bacterium]